MTIEELDRRVVHKMYRKGVLTWEGYHRLQELRRMGEDARAYWSGGESLGHPCVWAYNTRYTAEEWNILTARRA